MKVFVSLFLALVVSSACFGEQAATLNNRSSIEAEVKTLFAKGDFDKLNQLERSLRGSEKRSLSGYPLLPFFYFGVSDYIASKLRAPKQSKAIERQVLNWAKNYPMEAAGHIAVAELLTQRGALIRGTGWSNTVTPEQWKGLFEYLNQAQSHLIEHINIASASPEFYVELIYIYKQSRTTKAEMDQIISAGIKRFPLYYPIYLSAFNSYLPRWGGSIEKAEEFIASATKALDADDSDLFYAGAYLEALQTQQITIPNSRVDCNRFMRGAAKHWKKYPTDYNKENAVYAATLCVGNK